MSKNTKIIAAVGGGLIVVLILYSALTKGGCGGALDVYKGWFGCSAKKSEQKKSSRNLCVQNPNDPRCKAKKGVTKDKDDDDGDDAKKAPRKADDKAAPRPADARDMAAPAKKEDD